LTEGLLEELGAGKQNPERPGSKSLAKGQLWSGVPGRSISTFIRNFAFPSENVNIIGGRMADYIDAQIAMGELTEWTVFLATGDEGEAPFSGRTIETVLRSPGASSTDNRFIVRSILNRPDEAIDLSETEFADALQVTNDKRRLEGKDDDNVPSGPSIREVRGRRPQNGLLIIYPIDPGKAEIKSKVPLIGLVVSFPSSQKALQRLYIENTVRQRGNRK
jgi:hypothetical protein